MSNDSSTGGYIVPTEAPVNDSALDDLFQQMVVGITGLSGTVVLPRFQSEPPVLPKFGTNWCAIGVLDFGKPVFGAITHDSAADSGLGRDTQRVQQSLKIMASFYGPDAQAFAALMQAGLGLPQNRETLGLQGIFFSSFGNPIKAPQLVKERWTNRIDLPLFFNRELVYSYPIRNILTVVGTLNTEHVQVPIFVEGPSQ